MEEPAETVRTVLLLATPGLSMTLLALNDAVNPEGTEAETETEPIKPLLPLTVIVEDPDEPLGTPIGLGLAETLKSTKLKTTVTLWVSEPLVPVMVKP